MMQLVLGSCDSEPPVQVKARVANGGGRLPQTAKSETTSSVRDVTVREETRDKGSAVLRKTSVL